MIRRAFPGVLLAALLLGTSAAATGADIKVVSAVPLAPGLEQLADPFKRETGHVIQVQTANTAETNRILSANEPFDVLVTTTALTDQAVKDGRAVPSTRVMIGRVGIGIFIRNGAPSPNVSTPEALKQALLSADALVYNTAGSGQAVQKMLENMGIVAQVQSKVTRPTNAAQTMERIIQGKGSEIGFGLISEIKPYEQKGVRMAGPLPSALQSYINYEAIVSAGSRISTEAGAFIKYLTTGGARKILATTGVD